MDSEEKVELIRQLRDSSGWNLAEEELKRLISVKQVELEVLLEKGKTLEATFKCGEILGLKTSVMLPKKIYYQNLTILERIKLMIGGKENAND